MTSRHLVFEGPDQLARAAAKLVSSEIRGGARTLVLAGGSVNILACRFVAGETGVPWGRVTALFGDERCVPPDDPESNYRQAKEALLDAASPATVHRMSGELGPDEGARLYEEVVARAGPLDLLLLGMGPEGHTASLFPGHPALEAPGLVTGVRDSPKPPPERISLTLRALRSARRTLVLAAGADKAEAVALAIRGEVPAGMVGEATYLLDRAAASRLDAGS